jgi:hypothetical protein
MPQTCRSCEVISSITRHVLTNPFPHNQHLASSSSNAGNAVGGGQNHQSQDGDRLCINMVDAKIDVATRSRDYSSKQTIPGLESPPPPEMTLQIEKPEPQPRIPKGVLKCSTHNPMLELPRTTLLLRTWAKPLVQCQLWRYSRRVPHRGMPYSLL